MPLIAPCFVALDVSDVETVSAVLARQSVSRALNNTLTLKALHTQVRSIADAVLGLAQP